MFVPMTWRNRKEAQRKANKQIARQHRSGQSAQGGGGGTLPSGHLMVSTVYPASCSDTWRSPPCQRPDRMCVCDSLSSRNWCAFVSRRVVTVPVACGKEQYTIQSQSRCPSGTPDCQLVM